MFKHLLAIVTTEVALDTNNSAMVNFIINGHTRGHGNAEDPALICL